MGERGKKAVKEDFEEIIKLHKTTIRRYEKELKDSRFAWFHFGIRLNLWRMKRSLQHYEDKLNEYRRKGLV